MNAITVTGHAGELRWGYHQAAELAAWSLSENRLTATVKTSDTFRVMQQPLTFQVSRPRGPSWVWPVHSLQIAGSTLTAVLGSQE